MTLDPRVLALIGAMAALTYLTRIGGVWLAGRVPHPEGLESWLRPVPGAILTAIVAPAVVSAGWEGLLAVIVVILVMSRSGNLLLAATIGTGLIAALRW
jgi:uncharacterized membrane protein